MVLEEEDGEVSGRLTERGGTVVADGLAAVILAMAMRDNDYAEAEAFEHLYRAEWTNGPLRLKRQRSAVTARFDPAQKRDPNGQWGDGIPGPSLPDLDMEGFDLISRAEGTFGTLEMGVDDVGDVRLAFHEGSEARALDLGVDDVDDLHIILERLVQSRAGLDPDAESGEIYDDDRFGIDDAHTVELYGNGLISVSFGADEPDPYTLNLDPPDGEDDDVQAVIDAIGEVEQELDARPVEAKYNPAQPRDPGGEDGGQWVSGPAGKAAGVAKDALKLAGKIDLGADEKLVGSDKISNWRGTVRLAAVDSAGKRRLRLGVGDEAFGSRDDDAGPWRAGPDRTAEINAERKKLRDEEAALREELDRLDADPNADPAVKAAKSARLAEFDDGELETVDVPARGYTADIDAADLDRLRAAVPTALAKAARITAEYNDWWDQHDRLEKERDKLRGLDHVFTADEDARWDSLTEQLDALGEEPDVDQYEGESLVEGTIPGRWADIRWSVGFDDPVDGGQLHLGAVPHDHPTIRTLADVFREELGATLEDAEARRLLRMLDRYAGVRAAAGIDTHPGGEHLKHYWLHGEGAAKWSTWTELYHHLVKYLNPDMAKRTAAEWFHERYGDWPGSDTNKVRHGKPPRGHVVGPG
jgi:hypothetical protein